MRTKTWTPLVSLATALALLPLRVMAAGVEIVSTSGTAGSTVTVTVKLTGEASDLVAGTQNDITFNPSLVTVPAVDSKPNCTVNPDINKKIDGSLTFGFGFLKDGAACDPTADQCNAIRAIVLSTENVDAIPPGSTLFTCQFTLAGSASGTVDLTVPSEHAIGSDPTGQKLAGFGAASGVITVTDGVLCFGDCDGSGVNIVDLQNGLNIFFGADASSCPGYGTATVDIVALQKALNNFFIGASGCVQ